MTTTKVTKYYNELLAIFTKHTPINKFIYVLSLLDKHRNNLVSEFIRDLLQNYDQTCEIFYNARNDLMLLLRVPVEFGLLYQLNI